MTDDLAALLSAVPAEGSPGTLRWITDAVAAIESLAAENAAIRTLMNTYNLGGWTDSLSLLQRAERAEAERDALRQDAERYRWLRRARMAGEAYIVAFVALRMPCLTVADEKLLRNEELDAAIDAAIDSAIREAAKPTTGK